MKAKTGPSHPYFRGNRWGRRTPPPSLKGKKVELLTMVPKGNNRWDVTLNINGWPTTMKLWGRDELAIMAQLTVLRQEKDDDQHNG